MTSQNLPQSTTARNNSNGQPTIELLTVFDDLLQHGELTAAALVLGDMWASLPTAARADITSQLKANSNGTTAKLWATFDDLHQHGDYDAAALCLGDLWHLLPPRPRSLVAGAVKLAVGVATDES